MPKRRITITVDEERLAAVSSAVESGRAASVSEWVAGAIELRQADDERMASLRILLAEYEAEHGAFTAEELAKQVQADRDDAATTRARLRRTR
jgi:Arc/MetJ-type ribon-helix-helix transcriptional regulator